MRCKQHQIGRNAVPKAGPQTGTKSVPPSGSTDCWWNCKRGRIVASIGGQFFTPPCFRLSVAVIQSVQCRCSHAVQSYRCLILRTACKLRSLDTPAEICDAVSQGGDGVGAACAQSALAFKMVQTCSVEVHQWLPHVPAWSPRCGSVPTCDSVTLKALAS